MPNVTAAKLCGVEQRAPPIFGRATITLGIGPHFWLEIKRSRYTVPAQVRRTSAYHHTNTANE